MKSFAESAQRAAPALRGPGFAGAWCMFEGSLGLDLIPEPVQSLVRAGHHVDQDVLLGYRHQMLTTPPAEFQEWINSVFTRIDVPVLAVFGNPVSDGDRQRLGRFHDVRIQHHPGEGHFVHLIDPDRFATDLREFVRHCSARRCACLSAAQATELSEFQQVRWVPGQNYDI